MHERLWIFYLFHPSLNSWEMSIGKYGKLRGENLDLTVCWILIPKYLNDYWEIDRNYPTCACEEKQYSLYCAKGKLWCFQGAKVQFWVLFTRKGKFFPPN